MSAWQNLRGSRLQTVSLLFENLWVLTSAKKTFGQMPISLVCFVCLSVCFLQKESNMIITLLPSFSWSVSQIRNLHLHIHFLPSFMVLAQRKCSPLTRLIWVLYFHFGICFHRKVSAKAWNGISFFKINVLTNEISFWNIPAAVPVLLDHGRKIQPGC